jgi:integrase/recombinase XerD
MTLRALVTKYLAYKRALGHRFVSDGHVLQSFCRHIGGGPVTAVSVDRVLAFIYRAHTSPATAARKYRVLAGLARYACVRHRGATLRLPPAPRKRPSPFIPYIYSQEELKRLLDAAAATCTARTFIDAYVLRTLLLVLYGAKLRLGEALALNVADIDFEEAVLTIRQTKFYKTRLVPLGHDLADVLREYRRRHDRGHPHGPTAPFFCFRNSQRVSASALERTFRRLRVAAGVRREGGARQQPRLHDLRHAAAVHRVIQWYRGGADLQRLLPYLATYLGHVDLSSTQHYLTLTPELLHEASLRFQRYALENDHD